MENEVRRLTAALALAGQTLEVLCRYYKFCPLHYQLPISGWSSERCQQCEYRKAHINPHIYEFTKPYDADTRSMCWIEFFLWEVRNPE